MSIEKVRSYFIEYGIENKILEFPVSSATVALAAEAIGCEPARIAKTLSFKIGDDSILIVTAGDAKIDNSKYKGKFRTKAKMLTAEETAEKIGHEVGGVCPFAVPKSISIYLDVSMKRFKTVYPACGSSNSAAEFTCDELYKYSHALEWIDVCKGWQ